MRSSTNSSSRRQASGASRSSGTSSNTTLDETGVPNEAVLHAIEKLGYTCAVHDVTASCGLPRDLVEAEMAALLRASNGFFEVPSASANDDPSSSSRKEVEYQANVFSTDHVRYVYPPGLRALLRRRFVLMRMRDSLASITNVGFKIFRVSFGLLLLLSLLIVVVVIIVVVARSGGGDHHRHGHGLDAFRLLHRPRRHYIGGGGGNNDWFWFWYWFNYNPFFVGNGEMAQRWREQQARRRRVLNALDDEEAGASRGGGGGGTRRRAASSSSNRLARIQAEGHEEEEDEQEEEEDAEVEEDMTFLEAVFSLLFGDGSPGPSENQRWQYVAKLIHTQGGIVLPEEVVPLLTHVDPHKLDQSMLPVCARFGGKPVRCVDGKTGKDCGFLYDFSRMREGGRPSTLLAPSSSSSYSEKEEEVTAALLTTTSSSMASSVGGETVCLEMREMNDDKGGIGEEEEAEGGELVDDEDDDLVLGLSLSSCGGSGRGGYLEERRYGFSRAPTQMLQLAGALGLVNLVGAIWVHDQWVLFPEPGATVLYVVGQCLLWYAAAYLLIPMVRLVVISLWNRGIEKRNRMRRALWMEWTHAKADVSGAVYQKMEYAYKCRKEVGVGLGEELLLSSSASASTSSSARTMQVALV